MISIIIPVKNDEKNIRDAVISVLKQKTKEKTEVIVIDNNSTDNTLKMISDLNVKILSEKKPSASAVRNRGIRNSKGNILLFTDSDCVASKNWIKNHLDAQKRGDVVMGRTFLYPKYRKSIIAKSLDYGLLPYFDFNFIDNNKILEPWHLYTSNLSVKRKIFEKVGFFNEEFKYAGSEDTEFGFRLFFNGLKIIYEPKAKIFHKHKKDFKSAMKRAITAGRQAEFLKLKIGVAPRMSMIFKRFKKFLKFKDITIIDKILILFIAVLFLFGFLIGMLTIKKLYR